MIGRPMPKVFYIIMHDGIFGWERYEGTQLLLVWTGHGPGHDPAQIYEMQSPVQDDHSRLTMTWSPVVVAGVHQLRIEMTFRSSLPAGFGSESVYRGGVLAPWGTLHLGHGSNITGFNKLSDGVFGCVFGENYDLGVYGYEGSFNLRSLP